MVNLEGLDLSVLTPKMRENFLAVVEYRKQNPRATITHTVQVLGLHPSSYYAAAKKLGLLEGRSRKLSEGAQPKTPPAPMLHTIQVNQVKHDQVIIISCRAEDLDAALRALKAFGGE